MAVDVGSAIGYLDLDISGFMKGLETALNQTEASKNKIEALGTKVSGVGNKLESVGSKLTKKVTVPIVGLGTAAVTTTANFESAMSKVSAISGATGTDLVDLSEKAKEMGATTKFSASEAAEAFQYMAMAGWKTEDMLYGIEGVLNLAAASGEDLATTSDIVTDALTAFGLTAADTARFSNVLAAASSNANTNVSMMGETFKYAAPIAGALGYSIEDTAEAIGLMANSGIKGSQAGTTLRNIMTKLSGEIEICGEQLGEFTIQTTNSDGSMRDFNDILADCRTAFSQLSEAEQASVASSLVGQEAMSGFLALMNAAPQDIAKLRDAIDGANDGMGAAAEMAKTMQDNLTGQLTILKSTLEGLAISFGELMLPVIKDVVSGLQNLLTWINNLDEGQKKTIITIATIVAVVGPVLLVLGKLVSGVGSVITVIGKASSLFSGFSSAASTVAAPAEAAGKGVGSLAKSALNLLAAGAGILMAAGGLALLAQSSIALAEAGWPAIAVMGGLVGTLALLAVGAAAVGPALTAGAVGLVAFGGAIALVGVGVLAASSGVALLATQLPTISEYGSQAASALLELGGGLLSFGGGAMVAGAGLASLGSGLTIAAVGAVAAGVGIAALSVGVLALAAGTITLGAGLTLCGAGLTLMAASGETAANGMSSLAVAAAAAFLPISAGAISCGILDLALVSLMIPLAALTLELAASAAACGLLSAAMGSTASSVVTIKNSAKSAATSLKGLVKSVDTAKTGVSNLGTAVGNSMKAAESSTKQSMNSMSSSVKSSMSSMSSAVQTGANSCSSSMSNSMNSMNSAVKNGMSGILSSIKSGMGSAVSYLKSLKGQSYSWGADIIQGMANGIYAKLPTLRAAVNAAASIIYSNLHFSRPDEGPLRDYETWMPDFMQGLAKGINTNAYLVEDAVEDVAERMRITPEYSTSQLFTVSDTENLREYNVTLVNTLGIYKQLVEQMKLYSQYSSLVSPQSNGLLDAALVKNKEAPKISEAPVETDTSDNKPDVLNINLSVGEEQIETVVVDLLKREVRV